MMHGMQQFPSIIAKAEIMGIPGVGPIAKVAQCMLLNRSSKDSKRLIQE
jgi:1-acyl-sn-glycerol-3-phosphate acyltransferase